jgi:hypothetical protein
MVGGKSPSVDAKMAEIIAENVESATGGALQSEAENKEASAS